MKCGKCLTPGCPAIKKDKETGFSVIDETMCNGCGLCQQLCPFDAIQLKTTK
jgi:indolepyruvate ferredoxin oxidoreductase alpha subunit